MRELRFTIPDFYLDPTDTVGTTYVTIPFYNQDYEIEYSYSDIAFKNKNLTDKTFPDYSIAYNLELIKKYNYNFSGFSEAEKDSFIEIINKQNNSFQPLTLEEWIEDGYYNSKTVIIDGDSIQISKDIYDLWQISLTLTEIGN